MTMFLHMASRVARSDYCPGGDRVGVSRRRVECRDVPISLGSDISTLETLHDNALVLGQNLIITLPLSYRVLPKNHVTP